MKQSYWINQSDASVHCRRVVPYRTDRLLHISKRISTSQSYLMSIAVIAVAAASYQHHHRCLSYTATTGPQLAAPTEFRCLRLVSVFHLLFKTYFASSSSSSSSSSSLSSIFLHGRCLGDDMVRSTSPASAVLIIACINVV